MKNRNKALPKAPKPKKKKVSKQHKQIYALRKDILYVCDEVKELKNQLHEFMYLRGAQ